MVDWINISQNSGSGNATITVTATSYSQLLERSTALTVRTATKSAVVGITQRYNSSFTVSPATISAIPYSGASYSITVTANDNWSATTVPAWCSLSASGGTSGTSIITLTVSSNSGSARNDTLVFTCNGIQRTVSVSQAAYESEITPITLYPQVINIPSSGGSQEISIIYDDWWALSLGEGMWAEVSPYSDDPQHASGHGNTTLTITAGPNTGNTSRTVEIWVCDEDCASGTVVQEGYYVEPSGSITPSTITGSCIQNTTQIQITSNVSWTLEAPDWVYLSQSSGMSGTSIPVSVTMFANSSSGRSGTITLKNSNTTLDTASISQAAYSTPTIGENGYITRATSSGTYCFTFPRQVQVAGSAAATDNYGHIWPAQPWPTPGNESDTACFGVTADTFNVYYEAEDFYTPYPSTVFRVYLAAERLCQDRLVSTAVYNITSGGETAIFRTNPAIIDSITIDGNSVSVSDLLDLTRRGNAYTDYDVGSNEEVTFGYNFSSGLHTVVITSIAPIQFWKITTLKSITLSGSYLTMNTTPVLGGFSYSSLHFTESFYGCTNLETVNLNFTDTSCSGNNKCILPDFTYCTSLSSLTIPQYVSEVDASCFTYSGVIRINCLRETAPTLTGLDHFSRLPASGEIHVPANSNYPASNYWIWEQALPEGWSLVYDL